MVITHKRRNHVSRIQKFLNGALVPATQLGGDALLTRPATEFVDPVRVNTGKAESQWVGKLLIMLAVQNGEWHGVPWRMLRNTYMRYSTTARVLLCMTKVPPPPFEEEPAVTWTMGRGRPPETLLIGVQDMLERGLAIRTDIDGEAYFFPTDKLLACTYRVDTNGRPLDLAQA